ncbi:MAG: tetratricopeptide repeat protein, partial [Candidatus Omnitrophica bacterium]|nr:tetratricopeptide repeat protein [Candidatus Omnitrophota bacterium]
MKKIFINFILIMSYVSLSVTVVLPFVAEVHNNRALSLEKNSQWLKADQVYQRALQLNPFCVEYYNNRANFL